MSRDELTQMAELDDLSRRLEAAGRRAEHALRRDPAREQEIVGRLRAQLLGETDEQGDAEYEDPGRDRRLILLRPVVRTRLPGIRFSRSLVAGLAACLAIVGLAAAAPFWLPRPAPTPTLEATPSPSSTATVTATLAPLIEPLPSQSSTPHLPYAATPSPIEPASPSAVPTPTPTVKPTQSPATPQPTPRSTPTPTPTPTPLLSRPRRHSTWVRST